MSESLSAGGYEQFLTKVHKSNGDVLLPATIERYTSFVTRYESELLSSLSNKTFVGYVNDKVKESQSPVLYSAFVSFANYAGYDDDSIVIKSLKYPKLKASAHRSYRFLQSKVLTEGELRRLYYEIIQHDPMIVLLNSFFYDTACRREEVFNLKWSDIEFHFPPRDNVRYGTVHVLGKGSKAREVHFGKLTYEMLIEHKKKAVNTDEYVFRFYRKNGTLYKNQSWEYYHKLKTYARKILDRNIHPHCFRHTKLTHMANAGADIFGISKYAGHSDVKTTQIYIDASSFIGTRTFTLFSKDMVQL